VVHHALKLGAIALAALVLGSCGGGGGGGDGGGPTETPETLGVFTGFNGNFDWDAGGDGGGGVGGGATGDGGVGAGGDFGQFKGALVTVWKQDGTKIGEAVTDDVTGMVTIKPGRSYSGALRVEIRGTPTATYYEEGRKEFVPFPPDRVVRVWVPAITRNIGATPFTEAAYRLLTEGSTNEKAPDPARPTPAQIRAANERVRGILNQQFPSLLHVDDITRLPFIKSPAVEGQGSLKTDPRGRYGLVNGAFSKQAAQFNGESSAPTLDAVSQLAADLLDGQLDGRNANGPAAPVDKRTYEPNTLTGELSAALAEQADRYGNQEVKDVLPPLTSYGNTRYEGYLFDAAVRKDGSEQSTVAGWVAGNDRGLTIGSSANRVPTQRTFQVMANMGHGGGFFKTDSIGSRPRIFAVGDNVNGELGTGDTADSGFSAVELTSLSGTVTHMAGGFAHTLARLADGSVWAWGDNSFGQLGQGQDPGALPRSLVPTAVSLPLKALTVAATSVASYALLEDGTVWAWGSNGGFALLGNGQADGTSLSPVQVAGLADVVQLVARDNDVLVLRRDNTLWQWGSHPADASAFVPGDPTAPYLGGNRTPTQVPGLPANLKVRKILTEQGLFAALLDNGHVYTWGVHFDITAGQVLRDLTAQRVLGLPPIRDMMPGGFQGYGVRAFDRLTAMGVDYRGGVWKIRGRVGEVFDPDNPSAQRRPQGQAPRPDCQACHTFLDESLAELRTRLPAPSSTVCEPPTTVHGSATASLIHAETECVQCHNPARLNYPELAQPFASSGGWPNCAKPSNLPSRGFVAPAIISNACTVPIGHVFTPPGTVCASCHNSVIARPLNTLDPPCAQPNSDLLPSIATLITLSGVFDGTGSPIAAGSFTRALRHELRGTISASLASGQTLEVRRNGAALGTAVVSGGTWTWSAPSDAPQGTVTYSARVVGASSFGRTSNEWSVTVDSAPPAALAAITGFSDDALGAVAIGGYASDTTPTVNGTLSAALAAGESVQVWRGGALVGSATVSGSNWTFVQPTALAAGSYSWQARTVDAAGNQTALSSVAGLTIVTSLPTATVTSIVNDGNTTIAAGGATSDSTPTVRGSVSAALPTGYVVRVFRNGSAVATATLDVARTGWSYTEPNALTDGAYSYAARAEAGAVSGALSATYAISVDTAAPTQTASVTGIADDFVGALANGATTADPTPIVSGTLSATLAAGERVRLLRNGTQVALVSTGNTSWTYTEPTALSAATYTYQAQVIDGAGLLGALGSTRSVTIDPAAVPLQGAATTIATINSVAPAGGAVPVNNNRTPVVAGTIQRTLIGGEVVRIYRNGAAVGTATVSGTSWSYANSTLADGSYTFRAQIEQATNPTIYGLTSATITDPIDGTAPTQTATLVSLYDNTSTLVDVTNSYTTDTTPRLDGTLSAPLASGDYIRILRNGSEVSRIRPGGTTWSYVEPTALALGTWNYTVDVRDDAGNVGTVTAGATKSVTVISQASLPSATLTNATVSGTGSPGKPNGTSVASGGAIPDATPTLTVALGAPLPAGYQVSILRNGTQIGVLSSCASPCSFTPATADSDGTYSYQARTIAGTVQGTLSGVYSLTIDTVAPAQTISITQVSSDYAPTSTVAGATPSSALILNGGNTNDSTPIVRVTLGSGLAAGEFVSFRRGTTQVATSSAASCGANCYEAPADSAVAIVTNLANGNTSLPASSGGTGFQTIGAASYSVRVVDAAGFESSAPTYSVNVGYFLCDQTRANTTYGGTHTTLSAAAAPATRCSDCHAVGPNHPASPTGTPAGFFVAVPSTTAAYWCRRPS
jgi:Regulator of chromosome condensation (RCC1) repeat/Bacterial Ig-like domain